MNQVFPEYNSVISFNILGTKNILTVKEISQVTALLSILFFFKQ
jgi:hypothetical protein